MRRLLRSGLVFCFSAVLLSYKPRYHDLPRGYITMMHRSAVAPSGMKAPCALCHEIVAYSAGCTTAKSETKKCLVIGEDMPSFAFGFVSNPISSAGMLHATDARQCWSLHADISSPDKQTPRTNVDAQK